MNLPIEGDNEFSVSEANTTATWNCEGQDWAIPNIALGAALTVWPPSAVLTAKYSPDGVNFYGFATAITWNSTATVNPVSVTGAKLFRIETTTKSGSATQRLTADCAFTRDRP